MAISARELTDPCADNHDEDEEKRFWNALVARLHGIATT
jgi:hypothetical protein